MVRITMLIVLIGVVFILIGLLWSLRDAWRPRGISPAPVRETFLGPNDFPEATSDELGMLQSGYASAPGEYQTMLRETELMPVQTLVAQYEREVQQQEQQNAALEASVRQETQSLFQIDPRLSLEENLARIQAPSPTVAQVQAATVQRQEENQQMLERLDAAATDQCIQSTCRSIQEHQRAQCGEFQKQCLLIRDQDIVQCLNDFDQRCQTTAFRKCKTDCETRVQQKAKRNQLAQGEILYPNERLVSPSGTTHFILREDGALELYHLSTLIWNQVPLSSQQGTLTQTPYTLRLYSNGDLILKNGFNNDVWHTNTWMDLMNAGESNGPYVFRVSDKRIALLNRNGQILWSAGNSSSL